MALAYVLSQLSKRDDVRLTNYGEFLELHPPEWEVEIAEKTSWSCVHGVERWRSNCGCNSGRGWQQQWRGPLREAFDLLKNKLDLLFERRGKELFLDPWKARDAYISVILDRSEEPVGRFVRDHGRRQPALSEQEVREACWLQEMERHALLMYTSCGWFFDELSGLETVQVIQYAARVVELAEELFGNALEQRFLDKLALAKSNVPEHSDGATIYEKFVKPAKVDLPKLGAHYAMSSLFEDYPDKTRIYSYWVERDAYRLKRSGKMRLAFGKARITSEITQESEPLMFGVLHLGDHNLYCGSALLSNEYPQIAKAARDAFGRFDLDGTIQSIEAGFQGRTYSLKDLLRDEQRKVMDQVAGFALKESESIYQRIYEEQAPLLQVLNEFRIPIPKQMKAMAEVALNSLARRAVVSPELSLSSIQALLEECRIAGVTLDTAALEMTLRNNLEKSFQDFYRNPHDLQSLRKCREQVAAAKALPLPQVLWSIQNYSYEILQTVYPELKQRGESEWLAEFEQLADLLTLRVE
jgi:hypothetical protein